MSNLIVAFNDQFQEFVNHVNALFPNDIDILTTKNALMATRKANPKIIVKIWKKCIVEKYKTEIESGNIEFFINKDYSSDITSSNSDKIIQGINRLRAPIKDMDVENQQKTMKYIQILTKIANLCQL
jgi:hypothetical protein